MKTKINNVRVNSAWYSSEEFNRHYELDTRPYEDRKCYRFNHEWVKHPVCHIKADLVKVNKVRDGHRIKKFIGIPIKVKNYKEEYEVLNNIHLKFETKMGKTYCTNLEGNTFDFDTWKSTPLTFIKEDGTEIELPVDLDKELGLMCMNDFIDKTIKEFWG